MKSIRGILRLVLVAINIILFVSTNTLCAQNKIVKKVSTEANQGVAVDENFYYAISNIKITKHNKINDKIVASWEANLNSTYYSHFKHMNSGVVVNDKLYVAHSRYNVDPNFNTIEIWNVKNDLLEHERTIQMPRKYGSLTWADKHKDGSWWFCYAVYGDGDNAKTRLVKYQYKNEDFVEVKSWYFPKEVIDNWGDMSCSGGSWGSDGKLYTTGHDHDKAFVLEMDEIQNLRFVRTVSNVGFYGQAIAWDRFSEQPALWGIVKRKFITSTLIAE